ncbi:MAG: peptidoglycan editing factor PgeF [Anaerolineales bacterium]
MKRVIHNGLEFDTFESFNKLGITHAFFTRKGGVSPDPWSSLNMGGTVGDDIERVRQNRRKAFQAINLSIEKSFDVWQVHSNKVIKVEQPRDPSTPYIQADGMLTNKKGLVLFMRFADCVPILLADPQRQVIGIVHAGWKGTLTKIVQVAISTMQTQYGSNPADIVAGIGPSIGMHHYQVGDEVLAAAQETIPELIHEVFQVKKEQIFFDLWRANELILQNNGVKSIELAEQCTACHTEDWFSHRAEHGRTGRFGVLISL